MEKFLFLFFILALSVELANMAMVAFFFYRQLSIINILKTLFVPLIILVIALYSGYLLGIKGASYFVEIRIWLAASFFFLLAVKMVIDGFRFASLKLQINPTNSTGLISLSFFTAINGFLGAIGFGFLSPSGIIPIWMALPLLIIVLFFGMFIGLKIDRLYKTYSEWILASASLVISLLILYNQ